jgi:nucleoside-diphosphate-sugar epimerase
MIILLTGGSGNVGLSTLRALLDRGHSVRVLDKKGHPGSTVLQKFKKRIRIVWGDVRVKEDVMRSIEGVDAVIHTAAILPPLSDRNPRLAYEVNVTGTQNICDAIAGQTPQPGLVYTSSIAVYGDRVAAPFIRSTDEPNPNPRDEYARQKLEAEQRIRASVRKWLILRLSYIVSIDRLSMDPLLFELPPSTSIEICDTLDAGVALAHAVSSTGLWGRTLHIAGGRRCRISYGDYVDRMTELFGLGRRFFPLQAFSTAGLHCGFMDTDESERLLSYQSRSLGDFFRSVERRFRIASFFIKPFRRIIRYFLLLRSPYYSASRTG